MAVRITHEYYKELQSLLHQCLPDSALVHAVVKSLARGIPSGLQAWVDRWPHPRGVVVSPNEDTCQNKYRLTFVFIYSWADGGLQTIVKTPNVVNFNRQLLFFGLALEDLQRLERMFPEKRFIDDGTCDIFYASSKEELLVKDTSLPSNFHTGDFTRDIADRVIRNWEFAAPGAEDDVYDTYKWGFPAIAVYDDRNEPVAWVSQHLAGMIGYLHVTEKCRGQGIATAILSLITREIIDKDGFAFSHILKKNTVSKHLHEKVGFKQLPGDGSYFRTQCLPDFQWTLSGVFGTGSSSRSIKISVQGDYIMKTNIAEHFQILSQIVLISQNPDVITVQAYHSLYLG